MQLILLESIQRSLFRRCHFSSCKMCGFQRSCYFFYSLKSHISTSNHDPPANIWQFQVKTRELIILLELSKLSLHRLKIKLFYIFHSTSCTCIHIYEDVFNIFSLCLKVTNILTSYIFNACILSILYSNAICAIGDFKISNYYKLLKSIQIYDIWDK